MHYLLSRSSLRYVALVLLAAASLGFFAACGEETDEPDGSVYNLDTGGGQEDTGTQMGDTDDGADTTGADTGAADTGGGGDTGGGDTAAGGDDSDADSSDGGMEEGDAFSNVMECEMRAADLGTLQPGSAPMSRNVRLTPETPSSTKAACSQGDRPEQVFKFKVGGPNRTSIRVTNTGGDFDPVLELRKGSCKTEAKTTCSDMETFSFAADQDTTYYLIVEPGRNGTLKPTTSFDLEIQAETVKCSPPGGFRCAGGDKVEECFGAQGWQQYTCPDTCNQASPYTACTGISCKKPIVVNQFPMTFEGDHEPFLGAGTFKAHKSCSENPAQATNGIDTPGEEVFFQVKNLVEGEVIVIDASQENAAGGDNDHAIFVLDSCAMYEHAMSPMAVTKPGTNKCSDICCGAQDANDRLEFKAPADGDYLIVVDDLSFGVPPDRGIKVKFSRKSE